MSQNQGFVTIKIGDRLVSVFRTEARLPCAAVGPGIGSERLHVPSTPIPNSQSLHDPGDDDTRRPGLQNCPKPVLRERISLPPKQIPSLRIAFGRQMVQILSLRSGFGHFWSPGRRVSSSPGTCKLWEFGMGVLGTCKRSEPIPGLTAAHGRRASVSEADFGRIEILIVTNPWFWLTVISVILLSSSNLFIRHSSIWRIRASLTMLSEIVRDLFRTISAA